MKASEWCLPDLIGHLIQKLEGGGFGNKRIDLLPSGVARLFAAGFFDLTPDNDAESGEEYPGRMKDMLRFSEIQEQH